MIFRAYEDASWSTHQDQNSGEVAMNLTWSRQSIRSGMLPGEADLTHEWTTQPQLPSRRRRPANSNGRPPPGFEGGLLSNRESV